MFGLPRAGNSMEHGRSRLQIEKFRCFGALVRRCVVVVVFGEVLIDIYGGHKEHSRSRLQIGWT
jgi:hypothetical protein